MRDLIFHSGNPLQPLLTLADVLPGDVPAVGEVITLSLAQEVGMSVWSSGRYTVTAVGRHINDEGIWWHGREMRHSGPRALYLVEVVEGALTPGDQLTITIGQLASFFDGLEKRHD